MLNGKPEKKAKEETKALYINVENDRMFTSLRTGGVSSKSSSYFTKADQDTIINNILKSGRDWLDAYVEHLKKDEGPNFKIRMNSELTTFIHKTIYDETIDINDDFRQFLKYPVVNKGITVDEQEIYWLRFSWLVIFSVFQNKRIIELKELWDIPDEHRLNRTFDNPLNWNIFCSSGYAGSLFKIFSLDNGTIDIYVDFSIHGHVKEVPEFGSVVFWLPNGPNNYQEFDGYLKYEIRAIDGINSISVELQNDSNIGGHRYYAPHEISGEWKTYVLDFSKKTIFTKILSSFGAICFVIHPDDFEGTEYKAHFQLRNIRIELK